VIMMFIVSLRDAEERQFELQELVQPIQPVLSIQNYRYDNTRHFGRS
jgi:hypothetical protein